MPSLIYGWFDNKNIYELIKDEFSEEEQKTLYNLLHFKIENKLSNEKPIKPYTGVNKWTPDVYKKELETQNTTFVTTLYRTKYSAYDKINKLQKYIDKINYKYAVNLKINFYYKEMRGYKFILYFGDYIYDRNTIVSFDANKLTEYIGTWNRVKDKFKIEPMIHSII
ncbi:MAG TPA: hypothetical protein VJ201_02350 [Candidatus Babeliales bacterium]|nr:hypothetical protein [Candidatus Babeliales bacterium]